MKLTWNHYFYCAEIHPEHEHNNKNKPACIRLMKWWQSCRAQQCTGFTHQSLAVSLFPLEPPFFCCCCSVHFSLGVALLCHSAVKPWNCQYMLLKMSFQCIWTVATVNSCLIFLRCKLRVSNIYFSITSLVLSNAKLNFSPKDYIKQDSLFLLLHSDISDIPYSYNETIVIIRTVSIYMPSVFAFKHLKLWFIHAQFCLELKQ